MAHQRVAVGAIVVVSVAVAAAIAVYESPQARQFAEDCRRRIAIALHSLGDEINPQNRRPRFNRPEDAEGFMQSTAESGVDADEDTKRRQREELMYWNAVHMEKLAKEKKLATEERPKNASRGSSFDDFLQQDESQPKGTFVYNTGADVNHEPEEGLRNRGVRGLNRSSLYANPFADENHIDWEEQRAIDASLISPDASEKFEVMSEGIYSANEDPRPTRNTTATITEQLVDITEAVPVPPTSAPTSEHAEENTNYVNMASRDEDAFASIHAWADNANNSFYSPLPATPRPATPQQDSESPASSSCPSPMPSLGNSTPTRSVASGEEIWAPRSGATSEADVMSVDGDGISTPGSWTEVGSVVSENDVGSGVHN